MKRIDGPGRVMGAVCVALPIILAAAASMRYLPEYLSGGLLNPDTYMRLVRIQDMLDANQAISIVARDGSGHGTMLHWSHFLDGLVCALAWPLTMFADMHHAVHIEALMFGPLLLGLLGYTAAWAAAPFADRRWLFLGAILPALSPAIASYGLVGVVHHHIGVVIAALAAWGWAARIVLSADNGSREPVGMGIAMGAWIGAGIWLTPETTPLTLLAYGALWLTWITRPDAPAIPRAMIAAGVTATIVTAAALLADPPPEGILTGQIDRLSIIFPGLMLAIAVSAVLMAAASRRFTTPAGRAVAAAAISGCCAAAWVWCFRADLFQPGLFLSAADARAFFDGITEMAPVLGLAPMLMYLLTGAVTFLVLLTLAYRLRSVPVAYAALCTLAMFAMGQAHVRFAAYPEAAASVVFPIAITLISDAAEAWHPLKQSFVRLAAIVVFTAVPYLGRLPAFTAAAKAGTEAEAPSCRVVDAVDMLRPFAGAVVLSEVNDTPELLYRTQVRTVGSLYHRNPGAYSRLRAAWRAEPSDAAPIEIEAAGVSYILGCAGPARSPIVADLDRLTVSDQVRLGMPPPWLRAVAFNAASGQTLYAMIR